MSHAVLEASDNHWKFGTEIRNVLSIRWSELINESQ